MITLNRILHPTDFSESSAQAFEYARSLASRFDSSLYLLHVSEPISAAMLSPGAVPPPNFDEEQIFQAEQHLQKIDVGDYVPSKRVHREVVVGTPFLSIIGFAKENNTDLIILGTHGRSSLSQLLLGSTAEKVVRKSLCPVLTVRQDGQQFVMP